MTITPRSANRALDETLVIADNFQPQQTLTWTCVVRFFCLNFSRPMVLLMSVNTYRQFSERIWNGLSNT